MPRPARGVPSQRSPEKSRPAIVAITAVKGVVAPRAVEGVVARPALKTFIIIAAEDVVSVIRPNDDLDTDNFVTLCVAKSPTAGP